MTFPDPNQQHAEATLGLFRLATAAVERGVADVRAEWELLVRRVDDGIRVVERRLGGNGWWDSFVEWVTDDAEDALRRVRERLDSVRRQVDEVLGRAEAAFSRSLPVLSLMETGLRYLPVVVTPVSGIAADLDPPGKNLAYWDGPARSAYLGVVREQLDALNQSVGKARITSGWLVEVAAANTGYLAGLADRVARVAEGLATTCLEGSATAAGVLTQFPASLQDLAELVGTVVGELIGYSAHLAERLTEVVASVQRLAVEIADHSEIGGGRWPQSVVNA
ncbi:hypothetical protein Drose_19625 [Dactylosporangium roseum]|uniref:WXG100 family type VII secretion target n=1 Tax=Dactylosporangium roseum TaxID=47989 RepID=A0ABY5YXD6_9ACTN|nr:hypothetical protein [Dactylosporangium roseum]UWZ33523.1 hypothetical protein Drose_19625 [Dactylosporangium roseum]